jgi:hypothetical protein
LKPHWIKVRLVPEPDLSARPDYWRAKPVGESYPREEFSAKITDGPKEESLDGDGRIEYQGIPAGTCSFRFDEFFDAIEDYFEKELKELS